MFKPVPLQMTHILYFTKEAQGKEKGGVEATG